MRAVHMTSMILTLCDDMVVVDVLIIVFEWFGCLCCAGSRAR